MEAHHSAGRQAAETVRYQKQATVENEQAKKTAVLGAEDVMQKRQDEVAMNRLGRQTRFTDLGPNSESLQDHRRCDHIAARQFRR